MNRQRCQTGSIPEKIDDRRCEGCRLGWQAQQLTFRTCIYDLYDDGGGDDDDRCHHHGYHPHHVDFNMLTPERRRISVLEQQVEQQVRFRACAGSNRTYNQDHWLGALAACGGNCHRIFSYCVVLLPVLLSFFICLQASIMGFKDDSGTFVFKPRCAVQRCGY